MTAMRRIYRLVPFPATPVEGTFDLPEEHGPIVHVDFGPSPMDVRTIVPRTVWTAEVVETYDDDEVDRDDPGG